MQKTGKKRGWRLLCERIGSILRRVGDIEMLSHHLNSERWLLRQIGGCGHILHLVASPHSGRGDSGKGL